MENLLEKVTIVIPTRYRHPYLMRLLDYYDNSEAELLVADSTNVSFPGPKQYGNVRYFHYPDASYSEKMADVLQYVKTKYTVLCADDDFIIPSSILSCVEFLETQLDYASAQGHYVAFFHGENLWAYPLYLYATGYDVNLSQPEERIEQNMNPYMQLIYAVHRTQTLKHYFQIIRSQNINAVLIELGLGLIACINGRHRMLPVFYSAREIIMNSIGHLAPKFEKIVNDPGISEEYERFLTLITAHLCEKSGMALSEARGSVERAIDSFINKFIPENEGRHSIEYKMRKYVKLLVPEFLLRFRRNLVAKWRGKPFSDQYLKKQIEKTRDIPGFPFYDKKAEKEWETIKSFILKHNLRTRYPL
jgi:glycosyltransferase domain-containing protein